MEIPLKSNGKPDIEKLMLAIEQDVQDSVEQSGYVMPKFIPKKIEQSMEDSIKSCESLKYLNHNWNDWSVAPEFSSHRKYSGKIITLVKKFLNRIFKNNFKTYFDKELQFQENLVRHLNKSSEYIEQSNSKMFWSLVEKIDNDVKMVNERNDEIFTKLVDEINNLKQRISKLED